MGTKGGMRIFRYADRTDRLLLLFGTLGSIGDGMSMPLTMLILSNLINKYGSTYSKDHLTLSNHLVNEYGLKMLYVAIGVAFSAFIEGICWTRTAERQTSRMMMEYLKSVLRQDVGFFDNQADSSTTFQVISSVSSDAHSIRDVIAEKIPNCLTHLSSTIFCFLFSFLLSWRLASAVLPLTLLFFIPGAGFGKLMMNLGLKMKDAYGVAGGIAEQAISSVRTVYSYAGEIQTLNRFSQAHQKCTELGIKQGFVKGLLFGSMGMIYAVWACQALIGSILITEKGERGGAVFISGLCVVLGGLSIMGALPNISFFAEAKAAATRISEMIDRVPLIDSEDDSGKILEEVRGEIEFKEVYFSYPSRSDTLILEGFNLRVQAGETVGLVGESGSGKSTIISLLERFYDPVKGDILFDGCKLKTLSLKWVRSQMGLVNQEPVLFATSIKENILFGKEGAPMELVISASKAANAHDFITRLPEGYETQVGQLGIQLSGGEKQRIAMARALIRDPRILLLDEATSALDAQSERIVQEALDKASLGRTTIIIAHRLATIRKANTIVVLQSGRVVESGPHDEVLQMNNGKGGAYLRMVQLHQSTMQTEDTSIPYQSSGARSPNILMSAQSPKIPFRARSSWQSSPAFPFSPALSLNWEQSFDMPPNDDSKDEKPSYPTPSWHLLQMNAPEWKRSVLGCLGAVGAGGIQPFNAYCMGTLVSVYLLKDNSKIKSETKYYSFIFLSLTVLSFVTNHLQHYDFAIMGEHLTKRVREKMLANVLTFEIGWFDSDENTSAAICASLAMKANMVRSLIGDRMSLLVQVFTNASLSFVLALVVTWRLAIVMISMQPFLIWCFYSRTVLMKNMSEKARKAHDERSQLASEAAVNHRTITAFSSQKRLLGLFANTMKGPRKESIKQSWLSGVGMFISQFLTTASVALTYWYGGRLMTQGLISPKQIFRAFFILMSTSRNIAEVGNMTSDLAKAANAITSLFAILDRKSEIKPEDPEGIKVEKIKGEIELRNVFFCYPSRPEKMIFKGLNLKIEAGKTVAIVGQSGSGKSTVIALIERFYDPIKGSILIDEQDIKIYNLRNLRSHIGLVSQEPTLFADTIRQNILYGKENATEAEVRNASILANAQEFISSMKDGYETYCGERGVQLSGGQKQRIALARAILKNPAILLLDEATSALDSVSENIVQEALEKLMGGRTCVVVAHQLSTIQKSDSIAVIKNGKVVEQGSHSDLLAVGCGGSYYSLINLQCGDSATPLTKKAVEL
ncbi:putative multidrug resistance protein [Cornus florida]|uniref:putative multidrug resistance protein n=1 Tax=Cornus florida TaxID=4283 RepID=UPI00289BD6E8|nr:putative multidrug resistance protein [Cornus florida]